MNRLQGEQGVKVYHAKVKHLHNPPAHPIDEMHLICRDGWDTCLRVTFIGDPVTQEALCGFIRERNSELEKLGVLACRGPHAIVTLDVPVVSGECRGVMVCTMTCTDPKIHTRDTGIAHLMKKVGARLQTPAIPYPQLLGPGLAKAFLLGMN